MTHWLNNSISDRLDSDDDEELNNEWGISNSCATQSSLNKSLAKETKQETSLCKASSQSSKQTFKQEVSRKSGHCLIKSNDNRHDSKEEKIEQIVISDSDDESDENLSNQHQCINRINQVSSPPFSITSSDKKSDQTRRNYDIQGKNPLASESFDLQSVTAEGGKSVKLFREIESDSTLTQSDNEVVETIKKENPGQCSEVSVDNLNPTRQDLEQCETDIRISDRSTISPDKNVSTKNDNSVSLLDRSPTSKQDVVCFDPQAKRSGTSNNYMSKLLHTPNRSIFVPNSCSPTEAASSSDKLIDSECVASLLIHDDNAIHSSKQTDGTVNRAVTACSMADSTLPSCNQNSSKTSTTAVTMNLPSCSKTTISDYPDNVNFDQSMDDTISSHEASITKIQSSVTFDKIQATLSYDPEIIENFAQSTSSKAKLNKLSSSSTVKNSSNIQCVPETSPVEDVSDQFDYDRELESKNESAANDGNTKKRKRKKDDIDETTNDKKRKKKELMLKKQKEKSRKELEKEVGRLNTMEHCIELVSVQADRRLLEVDGGEEIWNHLKKSKAHCKIAENTIKNTILWKSGSIEIIENDEEVVSERAAVETENVIVYIPCVDFLQKASNEYNNDGCSSGLIAFVNRIKRTFRKKVVYIFVDQMASCFRNNGSTTKTEWENPLNRSQLQSVLLNLYFRTDAQVFMVDNMEIVGDMMARLIKATAQKPFKKSRSPTFDFFVETGSGGGKKISEKIDSVSEVWKNALLQLHNLGSNTADAIVNEYKTPRQLIMAYKSNREDGNQLLADIKARRGVAGSSERRIGPALSRNIHKIFTSLLPSEEI